MEEENIKELRENLLASLRPFCADPESVVDNLERRWEERDHQEADFTPMEAELVAQVRESVDYNRAACNRDALIQE